MSDGNLYCWMCGREIGNYPDRCNPVWFDGDDKASAICTEPCAAKFNKILERKFKIPVVVE